MRESVTIMLGGSSYELRPTWSAYADIEARTGKSIRNLWISIASGDIKLIELGIIVAAGIKAADPSKNVGEQQAMRSIYEAGTWWDQEDGVSTTILKYLESLGWTPEQLEKIKAEVEAETRAKASSAKSSPSARPSTD